MQAAMDYLRNRLRQDKDAELLFLQDGGMR